MAQLSLPVLNVTEPLYVFHPTKDPNSKETLATELLRGNPATAPETVQSRMDSDTMAFLGLPVRYPALRQSTMKDWAKCRRLFLLRHRFGLRKKGQRSRALDVGKFFHHLMAHKYLGTEDHLAVAAAGTMIEETIHNFEDAVGPFGTLNGIDLGTLSQELEQDLALARVMVEVFTQTYPVDATRYKTVGVELKIKVSHIGVKHKGSITVDHLVLDTEKNELWPIDHKTTSLSTLDRSATMPFEVQPQLYRVILQRAVKEGLIPGVDKDTPVAGFLHNTIRKPTIRMRVKDTFNDYLARTREWYAGTGEFSAKAAEWAQDPPLLQSWVRFPSTDLTDELKGMILETIRASRSRTDLFRFPRMGEQTGSCVGMGYSCEFLPLCRESPALWKQRIHDQNALYEVVPEEDPYESPFANQNAVCEKS